MRKALFILGFLADSDIDWLAAIGTRERLPEGSVLVKEGEPARTLYVLLEGTLSVRVAARGGEAINTLFAGEIVGELSFLDSRPPAASVVAERDSAVLAVPRDKLSIKLDSDTAFAARFYRALGVFLAHRLRQTIGLDAGVGVSSLSPDEEEPDELDPGLLDLVSLGASRFEYLLDRVGGA